MKNFILWIPDQEPNIASNFQHQKLNTWRYTSKFLIWPILGILKSDTLFLKLLWGSLGVIGAHVTIQTHPILTQNWGITEILRSYPDFFLWCPTKNNVGQCRTMSDNVGQSRTKSDKVGQSRGNLWGGDLFWSIFHPSNPKRLKND